MNESVSCIPFLQNVPAVATTVAPAALSPDGVVTLTQCNAAYDGRYDIKTDCMLAYVYGIDNGDALAAWASHIHTYTPNAVLGFMIAVNRDSGEYLERYAGDRGMMDVQTRADGSYRLHSKMGERCIYYMVPTESYVEYKWQVVRHFLNTGLVRTVAFEEPEFWNDAGYSEGFKQCYQAAYHQPWQPPETSADVRFRTQQLKAMLYVQAVDVLSQRIKQHFPDVRVLLATHSVDDYCAHGIATGLSFFGRLPCLDGVIGQTWSDGVSRPVPSAGRSASFAEAMATFQYRSYRPFLQPRHCLYLLQDPSSDNPNVTPAWRQENWRKTVVAFALQSHTALSQFTIWPQRAFLAAEADYQTIQLNVYKMFQELDRLPGTLYGGTPGIALALSDTASWCIGEENVLTGKSLASVFGMTFPLFQAGVAVDTVCLDTLQSADELADVTMLLLTYDCMKPLSPAANAAIADYVRAGGQVLYIGGNDGFAGLQDAWWTKQNTTPLANLLADLGLSVTIQPPGGVTILDLPPEYAQKAFFFTAEGVEPLEQINGAMVAFRASCGRGAITVVGLPSAAVAVSAAMTDRFMHWVRDLLQRSGRPLATASALASIRGRYCACCAMQTVALNADLVLLDLFDPSLACVSGHSVPAGTTGFYYNATDLMKEKAPCLLFTGGTETGNREETETRTRFTVAHPTGSWAASRVFCAGRTPAAVTASDTPVVTSYDATTDTLLIRHQQADVAVPATILVDWCL